MNSRSLLLAISFGFAGLAAGWFFASRGNHEADQRRYHQNKDSAGVATARAHRCPMHPWIRDDAGAKCTICGMDLVSVGGDSSQETSPGVVLLSPSSVSVLGVKTTPVSKRPLERTLRFAGTVEEDASRRRILSAFVAAWVEQSQVKSVGEAVRAGQPLVTLYSQGILSAEWELINAFRPGEPPSRSAGLATGRLRAIGLTDEQIEQLKTRSEPEETRTLLSLIDGTITLKNVASGQNVAAGDKLFEIADFSVMWFLFQVYPQDLPWLRVGQRVEVKLSAVPGKSFTGTIALIEPTFNATTQSTRVRVELPNPMVGEGETATRQIPLGVFGEGYVQLDAPEALTVPRVAVLDSGTGPVAYVDLGGGSAYEQRRIKLGLVGDTFVEVLEGLEEGEAVVTHGNLLIDAQAQLNRESVEPANAVSPSTITHAVVDVKLRDETAESVLSPIPPVTVSGEALASLVEAASAAASALASDDLSQYREIFPQLETRSNGLVLPALELGQDITSARRSFEVWSTSVADLVRPRRESLGIKIFQCPMSPVLKKARWIQKNGDLRNPFFGSKMLKCGVELK